MSNYRMTASRLVVVSVLWLGVCLGVGTSSARAAGPTQEDVFKSIQDNVGESADSGKVLMVMCGAAGLFILLALFSQRRKRDVSPKALNHPGKLLKEVTRGLPLRPREMKQLSALATATRRVDGQPLSSPLTLLLCPSLLAKGVQNKSLKVDRRALAAVYKKLQTSARAPASTASAKRS